ncbi:hypothetical protein [Oceanobacillus salinisoli]|uniref:hypothetical protein n=1 Tax=Oceanobacillus salinisoli TaxID=2678611 RepID=UPI0012E16ECE|nr:hypothetical protein [Oceanobacillus salinisoli]
MPYIPVVAAVIAVAGILFAFKSNIDKIKQEPDKLEKYQTKLFIGAAISEAIPIILIIYGFSAMETVALLTELYVPMTIVIALIVFSMIYIFLQTRLDVDEELKPAIRSFGIIGLGLVNAIPIISLVMLFLMVP